MEGRGGRFSDRRRKRHLAPTRLISSMTFFSLSVAQEFDDYRDADDAVYEMNGKELLGERLGKASYFRGVELLL